MSGSKTTQRETRNADEQIADRPSTPRRFSFFNGIHYCVTDGQQISLPIAESQHRAWLYAWRNETRAEALHPLHEDEQQCAIRHGRDKCMPKEKRFNCRISAEDHEKISSKAAEAGMTMTDFVIASCMNKRITVINDLKPMVNQLRRAGITLNRLEMLARDGRIQTVYLDEVRKEFSVLNENLTEILKRMR